MDYSIREATFAGRFYPAGIYEIEDLLRRIFSVERKNIRLNLASNEIIGGIVPHAGWIYSAPQAIHFYEILKLSAQQFSTIVIVNPNHTGMGTDYFNLCGYSHWKTPLGMIAIDQEISKALDIPPNKYAHLNEHSGEVQLPLLQYILPYPFHIVMVTMNNQSAESAKLLASKLYEASKQCGKKLLVIASSDFSHFETPFIGNQKDQLVIDQILKQNIQEIELTVKQNKISVCGYGPIMTLMEFANLCTNDYRIELLKKGNSGDVYPSDKVVDYASFLCYKTNGNDVK